jgi:glycosyltransferase involved in cell wall biosynthesis
MKEGGIFTILDNCLQKLSKYIEDKDIRVIALVHDKSKFYFSNIEYQEFPDAKKSWFNRLYYEYFYFKKVSRKLNPDIWFSLHDVSPNVIAKKRFVYCHHPTVFYKASFKDWKFDYKVGVFSILYKYLFQINITKNETVFVQQHWIKNEFEKLYKINNVMVCQPEFVSISSTKERILDATKIHFFYPLIARSFKNVEYIAQAIQLLPDSVKNKIQVHLTFEKGDSNYANFIINNYSIDQFNFVGKISRDEVFSYYQAMDCLLFPSKLETWGLPLSEAKGFDKPILAANLPYAKETVGNYEKVSFFDVENPNELTLLMIEFVSKTIQYQRNIATFEQQNQLNDWNSVFDFIFKE